jgi:hypothetical protein
VTRGARRRGVAFVVAVVLAAALGPIGAGRPAGDRAAAQEPSAEFALLQQPAWAPLGGSVVLRLDIPAALLPSDEDVQLRLRIHAAVETTAAFVRTVEGDRLGNRIADTFSVSVDDLLRDEQGAAYIGIGLTGTSAPPSFAITEPGVYPLELALRDGDETISSFVTWIVVADPTGTVVPDEPMQPVRLAQVWSLVSPPVLEPDGTAGARAQRELAPGGRLDDVATLLDDAGTMPLSVTAGPETLAAWTALAASNPRLAPGLARVTQALARPTTQLMSATFVPIDLPSLEAAGLGSELPDQLRAGSEALAASAGARPDSRAIAVEPADAAALARLRGLLVDRVVIDGAALAGDDLTPLAPFALTVGDATMLSAATSPAYEGLFASDVSPALRTQRLLAALSVLAFERDAPAGVVLSARTDWEPNVDAQHELIAALDGHPYVGAVTVDDLFASVPPAADDDGPVVRDLAPHQPAPFPITAGRYRTAQMELASLRSAVGPLDTDVQRGERALEVSLSTENTTREAEADLAVISAAADALQTGVSTAGRRVTLTARKADIPLTFVNNTGKPVSVRVQLASSKLLFPEGSERALTLADGTTTERFTVEARASGTFTMTVTLTAADGVLRLGAPERIQVRSGVFGGAGAALTVGALVFLALWWANHFRRTRRARRAALTP